MFEHVIASIFKHEAAEKPVNVQQLGVSLLRYVEHGRLVQPRVVQLHALEDVF